jgi:hypothetical protein
MELATNNEQDRMSAAFRIAEGYPLPRPKRSGADAGELVVLRHC